MVADVWVLAVGTLAHGGHLDRYARLLAPDELSRVHRFQVEADRLAYVAAHGLARLALSQREPDVEPAAWRFRHARHGRPEVDTPPASVPLTFNISHCRRAVACVVAAGQPCGVDVEQADRPGDLDLLADGVLTAAERAALAPLDERHRRTEFFRYWTLKEAYAKARGIGMSMPFHRHGFDLGGGQVTTYVAAGQERAAPDDGPHRWQFTQWFPTDDTVAAVALRDDGAEPTELVMHDDPPPLQ